MPCAILCVGDTGPFKTTAWTAVGEGDGYVRLSYERTFTTAVKIRVPFDVFDRYTEHCIAHGKTANLMPDNIPNVLREFSRTPRTTTPSPK